MELMSLVAYIWLRLVFFSDLKSLCPLSEEESGFSDEPHQGQIQGVHQSFNAAEKFVYMYNDVCF